MFAGKTLLITGGTCFNTILNYKLTDRGGGHVHRKNTVNHRRPKKTVLS
jgi:hypothetical protein